MDCTVTTRAEAPALVVQLAGEIDPGSAPTLKAELRETIAASGPQVVLDFSQVSFMDSTGLHLLLDIQAWCDEAGRSLRLVAVHGEPARVLDICEFDRFIEVERLDEGAPRPPAAVEPTAPASGSERPSRRPARQRAAGH